MAENVIIGAGLSGLVAAINLAREGRDVVVLERESRVGGSPLYHPSPEGTPMDMAGLEAFTSIDFDVPPAVQRFGVGRAVVYGEIIPTDMDAISSYMIERGPRSTSLDSYLYELAVREGVKFEFNHPIYSNDDLVALPPDTIIATGLYFEGFDAARVPYLTSFHFVSRQTAPSKDTNHVTIYHGPFTRDYAYTCSVNGIQFAHVFQRTPIGRDSLKAFEEAAYIAEGIEFKEWAHFTFPVPAATIKNPRLFAGDKILAGTLAGCMESYMFFGLLGAMVSGKIAATAVTDKAKALEQFELATSKFVAAYILKKIAGLQPHRVQEAALRFGLKKAFESPAASRVVKESMPGWLLCQEALKSDV